MGDFTLFLFYKRALGVGEVDSVGEDGPRGKETVFIVYVCVGSVVWEEG